MLVIEDGKYYNDTEQFNSIIIYDFKVPAQYALGVSPVLLLRFVFLVKRVNTYLNNSLFLFKFLNSCHRCKGCPTFCKACTSPTQCQSCKDGYYLNAK